MNIIIYLYARSVFNFSRVLVLVHVYVTGTHTGVGTPMCQDMYIPICEDEDSDSHAEWLGGVKNKARGKGMK